MDHISVCICTYKRPDMLVRTLDGVLSQVTDHAFTLELVIVDNDKECSAQGIAGSYRDKGPYRIIYDCEPEQSISLARNRAVRNATGNLIAFIDDDEFPADQRLYRKLHTCLKAQRADGVLGPVLPHFPDGAPSWLAKSGLCDRPRNATGSPIRGKDLRTGNILMSRDVFKPDGKWFDPALGRTGGSDGAFLWDQVKKGCRFFWCDEATVFETVPPERWSAAYYIRRNFRVGSAVGNVLRQTRKPGRLLLSASLLAGYTVLTPFALVAGKPRWMKIFVKICFHAGCLLSFFKLSRVPERK